MTEIVVKNASYKTRPVKIEEFLSKPRFTGEVNIWDSVKEDLVKLLSEDTPYNRALFFEPPGCGKTMKGALFLKWCLYRLANLRNPQAYYDLDKSTMIGVINMSISSRTASGTMYAKLRKLLIGSPWFRKYCPVDESVQSQIRLPDPLFAFAGNSSEAFPAGYDFFGAVVDEVTMFLNKSRKGAYSDQVQNIFEVLEERTESRFMDKGYVLAMGASSYVNDFVEDMIAEATEYDNILVVRRPLWYAMPRSRFSGKYFLFDTDKMKIVSNFVGEDLFTPENKKEIFAQIQQGLTVSGKTKARKKVPSPEQAAQSGKVLVKLAVV